MSHYQTFQQRVACEAICSVQSGACYFPNCVQPSKTRRAIHIRIDPATLIMRCRHDRNWLLGNVDSKSQARFVNVGEAFTEKLRRSVGDIQKRAPSTRALDLGIDCARRDITRSKRSSRIRSEE